MILTKAEQRQGVMVALYPSREVAESIAQPGGEPVEEIHLTVLYLGSAAKLDQPERLVPVVQAVAADTPPLHGEIAGVGYFTEGDGVDAVTWASADVPGLDRLRVAVCEATAAAGFKPGSVHGFTPHITLATSRIEPEIPNLDLAFDELALVIAGERHTFPLTGKQAGDRSDMRLRKRKAAPAEPEGEKVEKAFTTELWKDDAAQIVYGVVMQPGVTDSQGDVVGPEEIEQAAHRYLAESRKHDVQHAEEAVDVVPVESFIAPIDMEYAGRPVLKGSWVMAVHVADPEVWAQVTKGELTGFSIGGTAERIG